MTDPRVDSLVDEAMRLRLSRRSIMRRGAALGLSTAAVAGRPVIHGPRQRRPARGGAHSRIASSTSCRQPTSSRKVRSSSPRSPQEWGSQNGVAVTTDYIAWPDLQPRIAAAVEGGSGADIIEMWDIWPYLYYENMVPVEELAQAVSEEYGGFYDWVVDTASVDGKWYSVPHGNSSTAFAYRISLFEEAGIEDPKNNFPKTYEELFAVGKTLKEMGKPFGQALGHSQGDPPAFAYPFMWAHGAMEVEEDGTTVAINKPEFVEALQAFTQHWKDAYDETGLSWDDGANNRAFLSDQISGTLNGSSIYLAAVNAKAGESTLDYEVQVEPDDIWHAGFPGRTSRAVQCPRQSLDGGDELLAERGSGRGVPAALLYAGSLHPLAGGAGRIHHPDGAGLCRSGDLHRQLRPWRPYPAVSEYSRAKGYAGPSNQKAAETAARYVIVDTIAQAIQSGDAAGAVQQAEAQLQRIYGG